MTQQAQIKVTYIDAMGSDLSVVNAARVSFGKKADWEYQDSQTMRLAERDTKLIKYLAKHKHISPFGHAFASFHVKAPIFVARQLVKHKFLRWNEISRRYVDDEPEFYVPDTWRGRSADKKQGSDGVVEYEELHSQIYGDAEAEMKQGVDYYNFLVSRGVAPEQARMVLPQSTMTEWYWSGSLDAFADMCRLRCKEDTQYESRLVADRVSTIMQDLYPVSWAALMEGELETKLAADRTEVIARIRKDAENGDISHGAAQWVIDTILAELSSTTKGQDDAE
jgi:thymidylate synthase (FAD)